MSRNPVSLRDKYSELHSRVLLLQSQIEGAEEEGPYRDGYLDSADHHLKRIESSLKSLRAEVDKRSGKQ